jgi:hypothetical protein
MSKAAIRKFLAARSSQQLAQEILILHDRFPEVREYLSARVQLESSAKSFEKYVRLIDEEFSTSARNPKGRPSHGRQIIRAYKHVAVSNEDVIGLTLYYVSAVLRFMKAFGILEDAYARTVVSAFRGAAGLAAKHKVEHALAGAFEDVIEEAAAVWDIFDVDLRDIARRNGLLAEAP